MSKIVFFCIPASGHTNPTLEVVKELIRCGHEVLYYSYDIMRERIEATGAKYVSCDTYDCEQKLHPEDAARIGKDVAFSTNILVETTLALGEKVCEDMKEYQPDCIVADSMAVWGKAIALRLGIPFVSSTTTFAFNKESSKVMKQRFGDLVKLMISMPKINKNIQRLQKAGYPFKNILDLIQNDVHTNTIVYTSKAFQPCSETFTEKYCFVGPSIREAKEEFPASKKKTVYISMGTVNNVMVEFYQNCIAALKETGYRVIMSVGDLTDISELGQLPENFIVKKSVDQIAVLRHTDIFLTHCGMNSASEGLYFEVPLIMYPQTAEQGGVAKRVSDVGAGIYLENVAPEAIRAAVEQVLENDTYRDNASKISAGFRKSGGAKRAAEFILQMI